LRFVQGSEFVVKTLSRGANGREECNRGVGGSGVEGFPRKKPLSEWVGRGFGEYLGVILFWGDGVKRGWLDWILLRFFRQIYV